MKKRYGLLLLLLSAGFLFAQDIPKVAVLNASLGENVPINASAIVGDSINEMFVKSPKFQVTDRSALASLQEEKMFQLSGEVSDNDAVDIGKTIGARYICVSNVNVLGDTFSVSARLIEVETAQVVNQQTRRMRGGVEVLYDLADLVGGALTGLTVVTPASSQPPAEEEPVKETPVQKEEPVAQTQPERRTEPVAKTPSRTAPEPQSHLMFSFMFPSFDSEIYHTASGEVIYDVADFYGGTSEDIGVDLHYLEPFLKYGYISFGMTVSMQTMTIAGVDYDNFMNVEPYLGLGLIFAPLSFLDVYGGFTLGYLALVLGDFWDNSGEVAGGGAFGMELGSDLHFGGLGLTLRYRYAYAGELTGDVIFPNGEGDMGHGGVMVGVGFVY